MFVAGKLKKHFFLKTTMTEDAFKIFFKKIAFLTIFGLSSLLKKIPGKYQVIKGKVAMAFSVEVYYIYGWSIYYI